MSASRERHSHTVAVRKASGPVACGVFSSSAWSACRSRSSRKSAGESKRAPSLNSSSQLDIMTDCTASSAGLGIWLGGSQCSEPFWSAERAAAALRFAGATTGPSLPWLCGRGSEPWLVCGRDLMEPWLTGRD